MRKFTISKILIPLDFSETSLLALEHGVYMAQLYKAEITLIHVHETLLFTSGIDYSMMAVNMEFESSIEKTSKARLEKIAEEIKAKSDIKVNTRFEIGRAYAKIVDVAEEINSDVIIMGTHGVSGFREFILGSNAYRVATSAPCPVLSVQTHAKRIGFKNVVLPIDNSFPSRQKVNHAIEVARHYDSTIHILGLSTDEDEEMRGRLGIKVEQVEEYLKDHKVKYTSQVVQNTNLATMAMDFANKIDADLIMIMTEQEFDIKGIFMGPYAQQLINHSKIPVLSIRPDVPEYQNQSFNPF